MINLSKGGTVDLTKQAGGVLTKARIGLGWDQRAGAGPDFDLDASIVGLADNGLSAGEEWFVFYNRLRSPDDAIVHEGDERTGAADGDDEKITVDFSKVPAHVNELVIAVTIHEAAERGQHFGMVDKAYVRFTDLATDTDLARYDLAEDGAGAVSFVLGRAYREGGSWMFKAEGNASPAGLQGLVDTYKIS